MNNPVDESGEGAGFGMTTDTITAIKKALEGVTPGEWFHGHEWVYCLPRSGAKIHLNSEVLASSLYHEGRGFFAYYGG